MVREILELKPRTKVEFWTDRKYYRNVVKITTEIGMSWGGEAKVMRKVPYIRVRKVFSGKFRRYNWTFREYFENLGITCKDVIGKNIVGFLGFVGGMGQSLFRLWRDRPDVIFLKGGFVGLPVGLMARLLRIPYVVHESDATPGLANRILMRKAKVVGMGVPFETEKGRKNWEWVGIPVAAEFKKVSETKKKSLKKAFGFSEDRPLVVVTGGSQGSEHINEVMRGILPEMLKFASVGLVAGRKHYEEMVDLKKYEDWNKAKLESDFRLWNFSSVMYEVMGAADVVVSRAGATTIAELAMLSKAVILVPFEKLPGGHQTKNAEYLQSQGAAEVVRDEEMVKNPEILLEKVRGLVKSEKKRESLAEKLSEMSKKDASLRLAEILLEVGGEGK